jgi:hypothetical protein
VIVERTFSLTPMSDEMLTRVQDYADISADAALNELVQYGYVAYRMTVMNQLGLNPADGSMLDLPERPRD